MGKPILFDSISRAKFDTLSDDVKKRKNYQIKEEDGSVSKHIGGLEGGSGGAGIQYFNVISTVIDEDTKYVVDASCKDIADAGVFGLNMPAGIPIVEDGVDDETVYPQKAISFFNTFDESSGTAYFNVLGASKVHNCGCWADDGIILIGIEEN